MKLFPNKNYLNFLKTHSYFNSAKVNVENYIKKTFAQYPEKLIDNIFCTFSSFHFIEKYRTK